MGSSNPIPSTSMMEFRFMAIAALWSNKLRTALTMLGVIIGITAVIAVTSVGQGVQAATETNLQNLGTDVLQIQAGAAKIGNVRQEAGSATSLTWSDAQAIEAQAPAVDKVTAYLQQTAQVVYEENNLSTKVLGTDIHYAEVNNIALQAGRFFTQDELETAQPVAVLGPTVKAELFGIDRQAIGAKIRIRDQRYRVIGVLAVKGSQGGANPDKQLYVPLSNMSARLVGDNALSGVAIRGMAVKVKEQAQLEAAAFQITNLLRVRHDIYPARGDADDFRISAATDLVETLTSTIGLFTILVVAIAGISLVVGGIGIANIMLVSVVERTREIGIRKAVGATDRAILTQFLIEAIAIAAMGGLVGLGLGVAIAFIAATLFNLPFVISVWSIVLGVGLSCVTGVLAGVIPARNAAQLDLIIALRSD